MTPPRPSHPLKVALALFVLPAAFLTTAPGQGETAPTPGGGAPKPPAGLGRAVKTLEGEREIRARIDAFFQQLIAGETSEAFAGLMKGSALGKRQKAIDDLVADTAKIVESYGAIRAYETLRISRVGSRLLRFTYFSYSDDFPLKWEIYCFLGTKSEWQILDLAVNNSFNDLFDDPSVRRLSGAGS